jgi:hydrogenase nickel incorporation protein HypA/HybF
MHEISLLENILEILQSNARSQGYSQVKKVSLEIGQLSCVEAEALRFGFDVVMKGTLAENAQLEIHQQPSVGTCEQCQQTMAIETFHDPCCHCGSFRVTVIRGSELKIKDLLVV